MDHAHEHADPSAERGRPSQDDPEVRADRGAEPAVPADLVDEEVELIPEEEVEAAEAELDEDLGAGDDSRASDEEKAEVEGQLARLRGLVQGLTVQDLKSGAWFATLLTHSVATHAREVDAGWFRAKYPDLSPDAIADARIALASRYAAVAGGLTASAYTGAVAATVGSVGGASPLTVPAGLTSFALDLAYTTQMQLRLAYDMSVIYGRPLDLDDPEDLWRMIRIAFGIKAGEIAGNAALKGVPAIVRPLVKRIFSGSTLKAAQSLPVVGGHLLQRNIIKFSIPGIGIPVASAVNYWTTRTSGQYARGVFRAEAEIVETAGRLVANTSAPEALLRVLWLVVHADGKVSETERQILHHVIGRVERTDHMEAVLTELRSTVTIDEDSVWTAVEAVGDADRSLLLRAAEWAAGIDGSPKVGTGRILCRLRETFSQHPAVAGHAETEEEAAASRSWLQAVRGAAGDVTTSVGETASGVRDGVGRLGRSLRARRDERVLERAQRIQERRERED